MGFPPGILIILVRVSRDLLYIILRYLHFYFKFLPKTVPLDIENNISELNKFVTKAIIDCSIKCIPQKKFNNKLKLPEYSIDIIKWKNSMKPKNMKD